VSEILSDTFFPIDSPTLENMFRRMRALPNPSPRFRQICLVYLEPNEFFHATLLRGDG